MLYYAGRARAVDINGDPVSGAKLYFYLSGTSTPASVYADSAMTVSLPQPVRSNLAGFYPPIYFDDAVTLKSVEMTSADVSLPAGTVDPINAVAAPTPLESTAGVAPTNYSYPVLNSQRYGMLWDNSTDDTSALLKVLQTAASGSSVLAPRKVTLDSSNILSPTSARIPNGITFNPARVQIDGAGHALDFSSVTTGALSGIRLDVSFDGDGGGQAGYFSSRNILEDMQILGPGGTVNANSIGLDIADFAGSSGNYRAACGRLVNVAILGFKYGVRIGNGVFNWEFLNCCVQHSATHTTHTALYMPAPLTDGGEMINVTGGMWTGYDTIFDCGAGDLMVTGVRLDGANIIAKHAGFGSIVITDCYCEFTNGDNSAAKFQAVDNNATITVRNTRINVRPDLLAARTTPLFSAVSGATQYSSSINLDGVTFYGANFTAWHKRPALVEGANVHVTARNIHYDSFLWCPVPHASLQWLADPTMADATLSVAQFTMATSGGSNPARAAAVSDGVSTRDALKFTLPNTAAISSYSRATFIHSVVAGLRYTMCGDFLGALPSSNTVFEAIVTYKNSAGNTIEAFTSSLDVQNTVTFSTGGIDLSYAPAGADTITVQMQLRATASVAGNTNFYASPLYLGCASGES